MTPGAGALLSAGLVGDLDQVCSVRQSIVGGDRGEAQRAIDIRVLGGVDLRVLPDRGLDLGAAWFGGVPLAWVSDVGEVAPLPSLTGDDWSSAFGGGLVTTCGLQNVGLPSEGHGLHGAFSHRPADHVNIERTIVGDEIVASVEGVVEEYDAGGVHLRCVRRIETTTGSGRIEVVDQVTNLGTSVVPAPMLYHVNIGAPLWSPGATLVAPPGTTPLPRDAAAAAHLRGHAQAPAPETGGGERVFELVLPEPGSDRPVVHVRNESLGLELSVSWDARTMPRLHQWVHPAPNVYVLGIEPANCSVLGRAADRAAGRLPTLEPGEQRTTSVRVRVHQS